MSHNFKFRRVGNRAYKKWDLWEAGDFIIGKYRKDYDDNYGNRSFEFEVLESSFEDWPEGKVVGMGNGSLRFKFEDEDIQPGQVVKVEYIGQGVVEKGSFKGKNFHDIDVYLVDMDEVVDPVADPEL